MEKRISVFVRVKPVDGVQQWEVDPSHTEINSLDKKDKFRFGMKVFLFILLLFDINFNSESFFVDHIFGRTST